mgnify:CR=1 FL=1
MFSIDISTYKVSIEKVPSVGSIWVNFSYKNKLSEFLYSYLSEEVI